MHHGCTRRCGADLLKIRSASQRRLQPRLLLPLTPPHPCHAPHSLQPQPVDQPTRLPPARGGPDLGPRPPGLAGSGGSSSSSPPPPRYADDGSHGPAAFLEALQQRGRRRGLPPGPAAAERDAWRSQVGSPVVAFAWEKLCNSIVQQVRVGIQGPGSRVQQVRVGIQQVWVGIH